MWCEFPLKVRACIAKEKKNNHVNFTGNSDSQIPIDVLEKAFQ